MRRRRHNPSDTGSKSSIIARPMYPTRNGLEDRGRGSRGDEKNEVVHYDTKAMSKPFRISDTEAARVWNFLSHSRARVTHLVFRRCAVWSGG